MSIDPNALARLLQGSLVFCASCKQEMPSNHDQVLCGRVTTALESVRSCENQLTAMRRALMAAGIGLQ